MSRYTPYSTRQKGSGLAYTTRHMKTKDDKSTKMKKQLDILNSSFEDFEKGFEELKEKGSVCSCPPDVEARLLALEQALTQIPSAETIQNCLNTVANLNTLVTSFDSRLTTLESRVPDLDSLIEEVESLITVV